MERRLGIPKIKSLTGHNRQAGTQPAAPGGEAQLDIPPPPFQVHATAIAPTKQGSRMNLGLPRMALPELYPK